MTLKILSLDPGGTTGIALFQVLTPPQSLIQMPTRELGPQAHHSELWDFLYRFMPDVVVCERFQFRQKLGADYMAPEYIGIATLFCQMFDKQFKLQTPAQAKQFCPNWRLQGLGLYETNNRHAMDAIRHMVYFVTMDLKSTIFIQNPIATLEKS